jgi:hypothetical protein
MDAERLQNLEERLHEQAEATRATNELITQLFSMMRMRNVGDNVATPPSPSVSLPSYIHWEGCFTSLSAEECVALPADQAGDPRQL